jgi:hypothetical protein
MLFTIIVNVYNGENYIEQCISSIRKQSYTQFHCVLLDNCSTDLTVSIAEDLIIGDSRFSLYSTSTNISLYAARNIALDYAIGQYCLFHDVDDEWSSSHLSNIFLTIHRASGLPLWGYSKYAIYNSNTHSIAFPHALSSVFVPSFYLKYNYPICLSSLFIQTTTLRAIKFDPRLTMYGDFVLCLTLIPMSMPLTLPFCTVKYTIHSGQLNSTHSHLNRQELELLVGSIPPSPNPLSIYLNLQAIYCSCLSHPLIAFKLISKHPSLCPHLIGFCAFRLLSYVSVRIRCLQDK